MAYSKVLNRPMFNKHNSAYGRGIASNLVSDEERQRFNYGGRVGYNGGGFGEVLYDQSEFVLPGTSSFSGMRGIGSGYGPSRKRKKAELLKQELEGMDKSPQDIFYEKELEEARLGTSDKYKTGKEGIGLIEKEVEIDEPNGDLPHDPDSDQLYTDEEKKEKRSQMMLSMAERLIGGSRDKWGSTAQMKNIAGAVGDIRKIADPSERREMLAKYKAWGKAQAQRDITSREHQYKMERDPEYQMEQLMVEKRVPRTGAINQVYGTEITSIDDSNREKIDKKYKKGQLPEGFVAEIAGSYNIIRNGKWVKITEEEIIKNSPRLQKKS